MHIESILKYPVVFGVGLCVVLLVTPLWVRVATRLGLVDVPGGRKVHDRSVPVGGGVALFLAFHAACAALFLIPWAPFAGQVSIAWWLRILPLTSAVLILGLVDDWKGMRPWVKLLCQLAVAAAAYYAGIRVQNALGLNLPGWVDFAGTLIWFLAIMNAFNLIDGVDGLATGIAFVAAVGIGISLLFRRMPGDVLLFAGFAGACLGFLRYNFFPARVFLGDTGSLFLGFTLAALSISTSSKGPAIAAIGMPLLAVGIPLFDSVLAVWRRSIRRVLHEQEGDARPAIDQADAEHLHHRLLGQGRRHDQVAWLLYFGTAALASVGILSTVFNDKALGILAVAFVVITYTIFRHLAWVELRDTGELVLQGIARPVRRNLSLLFYIVADLLILNFAWLAATLLVSCAAVPGIGIKEAWLRAVPINVVVPFLVFASFRSYSRAWSFAGVVEYAALGVAGIAGGILSCALALIAGGAGTATSAVIVHKIVLFGLALPACVGIRACFRVVQELMNRPGRMRLETGADPTRTLIVGGGTDLSLYFRRRRSGVATRLDTVIVGVLSDDEALRGHSICGFRVLGTSASLVATVTDQKAKRVVWVGGDASVEDLQQSVGWPVELVHWFIAEEIKGSSSVATDA
jgi:UDP-GlcNAc:undecaprenyl-phosphate GlcNAc-1-phosphate transferase